jgi:hypothetical protein
LIHGDCASVARSVSGTRQASEERNVMSDEQHGLIERTESSAANPVGKSATINQMADNFALYGPKKRAAALDSLDAELRGDINSGSHSLRRRVQLMALRKKMCGVHEVLRKAKR